MRWVAILVILYVGSYIVIALGGEYKPSQSGRLRFAAGHGGLAITDVSHWQPALAEWETYVDVSGRSVSRGNLLGYFYSPLIRLHRACCRPSIYPFD